MVGSGNVADSDDVLPCMHGDGICYFFLLLIS